MTTTYRRVPSACACECGSFGCRVSLGVRGKRAPVKDNTHEYSSPTDKKGQTLLCFMKLSHKRRKQAKRPRSRAATLSRSVTKLDTKNEPHTSRYEHVTVGSYCKLAPHQHVLGRRVRRSSYSIPAHADELDDTLVEEHEVVDVASFQQAVRVRRDSNEPRESRVATSEEMHPSILSTATYIYTTTNKYNEIVQHITYQVKSKNENRECIINSTGTQRHNAAVKHKTYRCGKKIDNFAIIR